MPTPMHARGATAVCGRRSLDLDGGLVPHLDVARRAGGDLDHARDALLAEQRRIARAERAERRAAREKAQGAKTRDKRELELAFAG